MIWLQEGQNHQIVNNRFEDGGAVQDDEDVFNCLYADNVFLDSSWGGVEINGSNNVVKGCWFGVSPDGSEVGPCEKPLTVYGKNNTIGESGSEGRNYFIAPPGSTEPALHVSYGCSNLKVENNWFGLDGQTNVHGCRKAIQLSDAANVEIVGNAMVSNMYAVYSEESCSSSNLTIQGDLIGTDMTGDAPLGNAGNGILISHATFTTIGPNNKISANGDDGIEVWNAASHDNFVKANMIGGASDLGNQNHGIQLHTDDAGKAPFQIVYP